MSRRPLSGTGACCVGPVEHMIPRTSRLCRLWRLLFAFAKGIEEEECGGARGEQTEVEGCVGQCGGGGICTGARPLSHMPQSGRGGGGCVEGQAGAKGHHEPHNGPVCAKVNRHACQEGHRFAKGRPLPIAPPLVKGAGPWDQVRWSPTT